MPLPFLTAGVPPVSGGDVNRDWEGCRKGEMVDAVPRIEKEERKEDEMDREKSKRFDTGDDHVG